MKKIIYLANARMPTEKAHGIQIAKMCEAFAKQEISLELVLPRRFNSIKQDIFEYYRIKKSFTIKKLPCLDLISLNIPRIGLWIESISFALSSFFYLVSRKADVIYSRDSSILFLPALIGRKIVVEMHNLPGHLFFHRLVLEKAEAIIVLTRQLKLALTEKDVEKDKILVAADGVDLGFFNIDETREECRKRLNLPLDKKIVLYLGSLYPSKGVQTLADASRLLPANIKILLVGGPQEEKRKFEKRNQALKNILLLGHRPYSQIPFFLKAADIFVLPNSEKSEASKKWTSPMKMFEYMASQRPIVASDLPSIREILDEETAILVKPGNSSGLAQGIERLLENDELAQALVQRSFEKVKNYTWLKRSVRILDFIE